MSGSIERGERYYVLDGMRGLAALIIAIHHFTALSGLHEIFASASVAVDLFFCLGGFVIAHTYHRRLLGGMPLREYASRRLLRLYPMFVVGCAIGLLALVLDKVLGATSLSWSSIQGAAILNSLYLPFPNTDYVQVFSRRVEAPIFPLNGPAWSLFFALVANAVYALVVRRGAFAAAVLMAVSGVAMIAAGRTFGEAPGWGTHNMLGGLPRVMFAFFAGVVVFQLRPYTQRLPQVHPVFIIAFVVALLSVPRFDGHFYYWLGITLFLVPLVVAFAARHTGATPAARALCLFSAGMSYPIFCVHYPILMLFGLAFAAAVSKTLMLAYLATTLVAAYALLRYVERPVGEWLRPRPAAATP